MSTRAAAESAARAGFDVTSIDAFADLDQHPGVRALSLPRDVGTRFTAASAARASRAVACDAVAYLSNFENHPAAVRALAAGRMLWGNSPETLRRVRDPLQLAAALRQRRFATPRTYVVSGFSRTLPADGRWLMKPLRSGGGQQVRDWRPGSRLARSFYLQEFIEGTPGSVAFVAARREVVLLGVSRQLVGERVFGAAGYRYCGSILEQADSAILDGAGALATAVANDFGLVGLNGIDFIVRGGEPVAVEVNPRWTASMELVERAHGWSMFGVHAAACSSGDLPAESLLTRRLTGAVGKAIVFARHDVSVGDTRPWLEDETVRDVPRAGERIAAGGPVCSVYASGTNAAACHAALVGRADAVYAQLARWEILANRREAGLPVIANRREAGLPVIANRREAGLPVIANRREAGLPVIANRR